MKSTTIVYSVLIALLLWSNSYGARVALCFAATNKYTRFIEPFLTSCRTHFLKNHEVHYFIFTNEQIPQANDADVTVIHQEHQPWPYVTLFRFEEYYKARDHFADFDYIFAVDVDMLFVGDAGDEILSERVATQHPYFLDMDRSKYTYEDNPYSLACIPAHEGTHYFAGGLYGGSKDEFLRLVKTTSENIRNDHERSFVAVWHDESHLNRYFATNIPTKILSSSYCYPEHMELPMPKVLMALEKNKAEVRW